MDDSCKYNSGPITRGAEEVGYFFEESKTNEIGDETLSSYSRWELFPDGTFTCNTQRSWESWDIPEEGIFERSRYEELVNQMKELKTDWIDELTYIPDDEYFHEGLATFYKCGKWGFIDKKGIVVIPCIFDSAGDFSEGFAGIKCNEKWGFVDNTGREVIPCIYDEVEDFHEGFAGVKRNEKWGFVDNTGREVIPCIYDEVEDFHEGFAWIKHNEKWGFVDSTGREVVPCIYDSVHNFHEGLAEVERNEKWGFVDNTGREVIPCQYVSTMHFQEGKAQVNENDTQDRFSFARSWIYIDKTGRRIIEKKTENDSASQKISDPDDDLPF